MYHFQLGMKVVQGTNNTERYLDQHGLGHDTIVLEGQGIELVYTGVHNLHTNPYIAFTEHCPVEVYGVITV